MEFWPPFDKSSSPRSRWISAVPHAPVFGAASSAIDGHANLTAGIPRFRGWFRLRNEEPIDCFGLLVAVDAFPPTVFNAQLPIAWTPTLELTTHVRGRPEPGWLRCEFTTRFISGGFLEEDGEVWDSTGRLVAQSRQLALLPR